MVIDDTGSVKGIYAFIYWTKWRSGQVLPMPDWMTDSLTTLKDSATQLLIKYKSGALVTQSPLLSLLGGVVSDQMLLGPTCAPSNFPFNRWTTYFQKLSSHLIYINFPEAPWNPWVIFQGDINLNDKFWAQYIDFMLTCDKWKINCSQANSSTKTDTNSIFKV